MTWAWGYHHFNGATPIAGCLVDDLMFVSWKSPLTSINPDAQNAAGIYFTYIYPQKWPNYVKVNIFQHHLEHLGKIDGFGGPPGPPISGHRPYLPRSPKSSATFSSVHRTGLHPPRRAPRRWPAERVSLRTPDRATGRPDRWLWEMAIDGGEHPPFFECVNQR